MPYSLRPAAESDVEAMMVIGHEGIRPYVEQIWGWAQDDQERRFRENFNVERVRIISVKGHEVGYVDVDYHDDHVFLSGIYLHRDHRGHGIGSELIRDLLITCRGLRKPMRLRVLRSNPAQRLYQRLGFRQIQITETHVYMEWAPREGKIPVSTRENTAG